MKLSQIISYVVVLLIGGGVGYLIGASSKKQVPSNAIVSPEPPKAPETTVAPTPATAKNAPSYNTPVAGSTVATPTNSSTPSTQSNAKPTVIETLPNTDLCFTEGILDNLLTQYAEKIEALELAYDPSKMQDCSGIFFRLVNEFAQKRCPEYKYPDPKSARPCRMIAKWYHDNKNFSFIEDPMAQRNLIKPGAVMFYGPPGRSFNNMTVERMCGPSGAIHHIGVVTSIEKDEQGNLLSYTLFHGQTYGKNASRTTHSAKGPSRYNYPLLGFGSEQWVGISYLFTPAA
jgi:hypothetical protein